LAVLALLLLSILSVSASAQERQTDFSKFVNWIWENVHMKMTGFDLLIVDEPVRIQSVENISDCGFSFAENGVYTLNRSINSSNTCLAINANNVTLDCQGNSIIGNGSGEGIYSNNTDNVIVKNCIITNFSTGIEFFNGMDSIMTNNTLSNNTDSGITLGSSSNSNLTDNIFSLNDGGLYFYNSSNGTFMDNRFDSNYNFGILLMEGSNYNTFSNNVLSINRSNNLNYLPNGIVISSSSYNTLDNNTFSETGIAGRQMLWIIGSSLEEFQNNVTDTNTINSLQTYYRSSRYGGCLASPVDASNYSWIGLVNCSGVDITGNLSNNLDHVLLAYTDGTNITGINVTGSLVGISVYSSKDNQFKSNFISSNLVEGFNLDFSSNNALSGNTISLNSYGIYLSASFNNTIYNNFFNQSINVHSDGFPNFWNTTKVPGTSIIHGPNIGGNFWAKPLGGFSENCTDANSDGICDDSYIINANNTDYLPLKALVSLTPSSPGGGGGGGGCSGTWSCTDWNSECAEGKQYRECKCSCPNAKDCKGDNATMRECSPGEIPVPAPQPITCSENWICSDWGQCESEINVDDVLSSDVINSVQFWHQRQCHDTNSCKEDKIEKVLCMQDTQIIVKKYFLDGSTVYDIFSAVNDTNLSRAAKIVLFGDKMDIYLEKPSKILKGQMPAQPPASSNIWAWTVGFMLSLAIIGISWAIRIRMLESSLKKGIGKMYSSLGRGDVKKARGEYQEMKKIYRKLPGRYQKKYYANILKLYRGLLQ